MDRQKIGRIASVGIAGVVLFGLELGYGVAYYYAIPAALVVYTALRFAFGLTLEADDHAP